MMLPPGGVDADEVVPYDDPRGSCPACGGGDVRHLVIGLPMDPEATTMTPTWVDWVGCVHPGYDRECERCGLTWDSEDPRREAHEIRVLNAECPVCTSYGPHDPNGAGMFTCALCKTTFGTGRPADESSVIVDDDDGDWAKRNL